MSNLLRSCKVPRTIIDRHQTADANPCHLDWAKLSKLDTVPDDSYPTTLLEDLECRLNEGDLTAYPGSLLIHLPGIHTWEDSWPSYQPLVR
jgi:hypothetical protein